LFQDLRRLIDVSIQIIIIEIVIVLGKYFGYNPINYLHTVANVVYNLVSRG